MMLKTVVRTIFDSMLLTGRRTELTTAGLGVALVVCAAYTLLARLLRVSLRWAPWLSPVIGLVTGLVTAATGVVVMPAVPYFQSPDLERDDLVLALRLSFTVSTIALAVGLIWHGAAPVENLLISTLAVIPPLLGMAAGQVIRTRIRPQLFGRLFLIFLLLLDLEMTLHGLL